MRLNFLNTIKFLAFGFLLLLGSCSKEVELSGNPGNGTSADGKVKLKLFAKIPDYTPPVTRTGSAQENVIDMTPWVLVFKGTDGDARFVEAAQAINMAGQRFVTLTKQTTDCQLLILANPEGYFTSTSGTTYPFSTASFNALLNPQDDITKSAKLSEACTMMMTQSLASPQTTVPFAATADPKPRIPMSYLHDVEDISESTKISGPNGTPLEMERVVAKVVVENAAANFDLKGATVVNAPKSGWLHRYGSTLKDNSASEKLTDYKAVVAAPDDEVTGIATAVAATQSTATNPIYLYESRTDENTCVIIKGTYEGVDYYYKLSFLSTDGTVMNVLRNYVYTFNIASVGRPGFANLGDAIAAMRPSNEDITWTITVSDQYSHDIVDNGEYYLGVTNSVYIACGDGALDDMHAFTVTTDRTETLTDNSITVSGAGLSLAAPANGKIPLAIGTILSPCDVKLNMTAEFTSGTVTLRLGNLVKTVTVEKRPAIEGVIPFMEFSGDYLSAEIESGDWLSLSADGLNKQGDYINTKDGTLYIIPELNYGVIGTPKNDGVVYLSRRDNTDGRIKMDIAQKVTPITPSSMTGLPYPYVGTFHRASETGERLIRIPTGTGNTGAWKAEVIAGRDFIVLANGFRNGGIGWPYEDTDAELYPVEGDALEISGNVGSATEEIRFRVGMKSQLSNVNPDWNTPPRYGLILVTYGGDAENKWLIYVRQGEAADYVMGTSIKWMPLNLSDPLRGSVGHTGGANLNDHAVFTPRAAFTDKAFADYPSQAGFYFMWSGNGGNSSNAIRAYHPSNPSGATTPWPAPSILQWQPENDVCPSGYRHPKWGATSDVSEIASLDRLKYWGYLADGFFDRNSMKNTNFTNYSTTGKDHSVAYIGSLMINPLNNASIFLPGAGYRRDSEIVQNGHTGHFFASYSPDYISQGATNTWAVRESQFYLVGNGSKNNGFTIRCVKDE